VNAVKPEGVAERPIDAVRGTGDVLPAEFARLAALEALLLDRFARAGYEPMHTPVLEFTELHERKSGAGIVAKLFELAGAGQGGVCLRPELTAGIVRAYTAATEPLALPWRVSHAGPVFRYETPRPGRLREFQQVGVERLGDSGPIADAEMIWLADWAASEAGIRSTSIRIGHVGLILEMLERSGLPTPLGSALVEMLSEAAAEGEGVRALETGLEQLAGWLRSGEGVEMPGLGDDGGATDRMFRTLVPVVTGRRSGLEIVHRLRRKWDLGHGLLGALEQVRIQVHELSGLKGKALDALQLLGPEGKSLAPDSVASLRALMQALEAFGVDLGRVTLDLGFGRGIGFYSRMIFEVVAETPEGPVEICGGGRYDGLARVLGSERDDRGVGFAFGLERLANVLDAQGAKPRMSDAHGLIVVATDPVFGPDAARIATYLRSKGARVVLESGKAVEAVLADAEVKGLSPVLAVQGRAEDPGALMLHESRGGSGTEIVPGMLAKLAREAMKEPPR
jgi:histidyl-tRNA synthetase